LLVIGCDRGRHAGLAPDASGADAAVGSGALRVLFIGNSYTQTNDLPGMLSRIAATAGTPPTIEVAQVVQGSARLEDHWNGGVAQQRIAEGTWTHVVLQEQSIEPAADYYFIDAFVRSRFLEFAQPFAALVRDAGARPVWFATWARAAGGPFYLDNGDADPDALQDVLTAAYLKAAKLSPDSILACVGEAFRSSLRSHPEITLHQSDTSHPTMAGTYLAAATFYVALTGKPVAPESEVPAGLGAGDAAALREVAWSGSSCGHPRIRGLVRIVDEWYYDLSTRLPNDLGIHERDFLVAGSPIERRFYLANAGETAVGLADAHTLEPPYSWTSGAYPGTSATGMDGIAPCSDSLAPRSVCLLSLSYSGAVSATGVMTLRMTDAYRDELTLALKGQSTEGALLWLEHKGCTLRDSRGCSTDAFRPSLSPWSTGSVSITGRVGESLPVHVVVYNYGRQTASSITAGFLPPWWSWGMTDQDEQFPGGSGSVSINGVTYDYCPSELKAGAVCVVRLSFSPTEIGCLPADLRLTYASTTNLDVKSMRFRGCGVQAR
jgi:hypothetical protein